MVAAGLFLLVAFCLLLPVGIVISNVQAEPPSTGGPLPPVQGVSPDLVSDQVAATAAEFRVDESGAATYSIPIFTAPGTAGVTPKLSLNYSSQAGNGPMGRGWSIGGLSSIARCRATREAGDFIVSGQATDGNPAPINYTATDRYCLDGQRLIPATVTCPAASGMTAIALGTEIETFQRVCAYTPTGGGNGPAFFTVERKDGSTSWYGDRDNSLSSNRPDGYLNSTAPGKQALALVWGQTRFQDSTGNYIDFLYAEGGASNPGEHQISKVRYTGKTVLSGQQGSPLQPYAEVVFNYTQTYFDTQAYISGGLVRSRSKLDSVTSAIDHDGDGNFSQVRHYVLSYGNGVGAVTLSAVQECSSEARTVCAAPTTFEWSTPWTVANHLFETQENSAAIPNGSLAKFEGMKFGDIDGDGRQDLVWMKDGSSGEACSTEYVYVAFSRFTPEGSPYWTIGNPVMCTPAELGYDPPDYSWFLLDYDGDGREDIFFRGSSRWLGYRSNGDYYHPFQSGVDLLSELVQPIPRGTSKETEPQQADLNGDGLIDLVYPRGTQLIARLMERGGSYGYRWGNERLVNMISDTCTNNCYALQGLYRKSNYQQLNDFDGDARSDLLINLAGSCGGGGGGGGGPRNPPTQPFVWSQSQAAAVPKGNICMVAVPFTIDMVTATQVTVRRYGDVAFSTSEAMSFADINGDGLTDPIFHGTTTGVPGYQLNTGTGFVNGGNLGLGVNTKYLQVSDANGDGRADILYPGASYGLSYGQFVARFGSASGTFSDAVTMPNAATGCDDNLCLANRTFAFTDVDGDGNPDFMRIRWDNDSSSPVYFSRGNAAHRFIPRNAITRIVNGLGAQTNIVYAPLTNAAVYRRDIGTRNTTAWGRGAPTQDLLAPTYVVARASSSSPQAGNPAALATVHYRYAGAKVQAGGRGFLGFREIVTFDSNESGGYIVTGTTYAQNFPFIGMPLSTVKRAVIGSSYAVPGCLTGAISDGCFALPGQSFPSVGGSTFSTSIQQWESDTDIGNATVPATPGTQKPVHVRTMGTEETLADPYTGAQTSRVLTTFGYAAYGNVASTTVDTYTLTYTTPSATVITVNQYSQDNAAKWRLGRMTTSTVTHRRPNRADIVRTTSFNYEMAGAATGLLSEERLQSTEPGAGARQDLRKRYTYDAYGNRTSVTLCSGAVSSCDSNIDFHPIDPAVVHRTSSTIYGFNGRLPLSTVELFWGGTEAVARHTSDVFGYDIFGNPLQVNGLNGAESRFVYGAMGRPYYSWNRSEPNSGYSPGHGQESRTVYRWCGSGANQVSCPAGASFRQAVMANGAPTQWSYLDVLGREVFKAVETFNAGISGKDISAVCTDYTATGKPARVSNPFFLAGVQGADGPTGLASVCSAGARKWTLTTYDVLGRPTKTTGPDNASVTTAYSGLVTTMTDPRGKVTVQSRIGTGELQQVTDANGLVLTNAYYADGSLNYVTRDAGRGAVTNYFYYDGLGRKIQQNDPDTGVTRFEYNAAGELTAQLNPDGSRIDNEIDARGRVWRKTVKRADGAIESQSTTTFDTAPMGTGQVAYETISGAYTGWSGEGGTALNYGRSYSYDGLGRPLGSVTNIDGVSYPTALVYDELGRPWKAKDVSGRWVRTEYSPRGQAAALCNSAADDYATTCPNSIDTYLRTLQTDEWGHVTRERRGNSAAMDVVREYWADTGRIAGICAGNQATCNLMDEGYAWDAAGNLSAHQKETRYLEAFTYDNINRLARASVLMFNGLPDSTTTQWFEYDMLGNLCRRYEQGGGDYSYRYVGRSGCGLGGANSGYGAGGAGTTGAHQIGGTDAIAPLPANPGSVARTMAQGANNFYFYDARGNQIDKQTGTPGYDRRIQYSVDDHAYEIALGTGQRTRFWYGPDGARYKREDGGKRTLYLGNVEIVTENGVVTTKRTIGGVMLQTVVGSTATNHYLFHDQLGSLARVTDASGGVINVQDYSAFGERRNPTSQVPGATAPSLTTRGFTGHEHVDGMNVIHMNGRIYDAALGRFLQADPLIQAPDNAQSWNAYTYVFNNPLRYTDPTGMLGLEERQWLGAIIAIVASIWTGGASAGWWATGMTSGQVLAVAAVAGFASGAIATKSLQGGVFGAFSALLGAGLGGPATGFDAWAVRTLAGGVMGSLQGGDFGHAFLSAGLTAAFMPQVGGIHNGVLRTLSGALIGGTISRLTGGKFANGAVSGAIQAALANNRKGSSQKRRVQPKVPVQEATGAPSRDIALLMRSSRPADRILAAKAAIDSFGIRGTGYNLFFNPHLNDASAQVNPWGDVELGPDAFGSWSELGVTLGHEIELHWEMQFKKYGPISSTQEYNMREYQADQYELDNSSRFGLTPRQIENSNYWLNRHYNALTAANKQLVDIGIYEEPGN